MNMMLKDPPATTRASYGVLERQYGARNYQPFDVVLTRGLGVWVWDVDGRRYLDCLSAYSAVNQGHCHPRILAALTEQASRLAITSRAFMNDQLPLFCHELCAATHSHKVLPMNSGAEAVESAIKVARKWGYEIKGVPQDRAEVVVCANNFHGRTLTIVGFSTDATARDGFGPFTPGFSRITPFGDAAALEAAITPNTVAFLVEPIQGEAGVIIPPAGYFKSVREICTRHNVILILDEIQTGLGRTGRLLAEEHEGIEADLTLIGKALSGGFYPVSAVLSNDEVLGVLKPGGARQHVRRQPSRLRRRTRSPQSSHRGRHGRKRLRDGESLPRWSAPHQELRGKGGTRPRPHDRHRVAPASRRRSSLLRRAASARCSMQGHARSHHSR
jgi:ornithine--oxo-acid transaminase